MVHIPFFNIDVPEPRIADIIPEVFSLFVKICSRVVDVTLNTAVPLSKEEHEVVVEEAIQALPREFDRVIIRELEGKIKNDEMLSSELEDASFDYYRRKLRTGAAGFSDEPEEAFAARQLGLTQHSASQQLISRHAAANPHLYDVDAGLQNLAEQVGLPAGKEVELVESLQQGPRSYLAAHTRLQEQADMVRSLNKRVRTSGQHAVRVVGHAGLGVGLGVLVFRGLVLGAQHALKSLKRARKQAQAGGRPTGPIQRASRTPPAASTAPSVKGTTAQQGKGPATSTAASTPSKDTAGTPARRPRPTTRTR